MEGNSDLKKKLNVFGLTMIVIGACVGSGIFITPAETIKVIPHYGYAIIPWILGGVATFFGALTFSELGARFPKAGGVYVYLREAFGSMVGFLYGWIILFIVNTGAMAALGYAFVEFLGIVIPIDESLQSYVVIAVIMSLSIVNIFGVGLSQVMTSLFTVLKLLAIFVIIVLGVWYMSGDATNITEGVSVGQPPSLMKGILLAFVGVFWSMGGWHHATYLSGETINPKRTVPRAMLLGTLVVTIIYILVIFGYMNMLPLQEMAVSQRVAGDAVSSIVSWGGIFIAVSISISIFGTIAIYTMTAPRIYYAMAKDGVFFNFLAKTHPTYKTPANAIIMQAVWASILVLIWGSFSKLMNFVVFMDILFMALTAITIFFFRKRSSEKPSFYLKVYPLIPLVYLLITISFVVLQILELDMTAMAGLLILLVGVVAYLGLYNKKLP